MPRSVLAALLSVGVAVAACSGGGRSTPPRPPPYGPSPPLPWSAAPPAPEASGPTPAQHPPTADHSCDQQLLWLRNVGLGVITAVALSNNGRYLAAAGGADAVIAVWETHSGRPLVRLPRGGAPDELAISDDGNIVAYAGIDSGIPVPDYKAGVVDLLRRRPPYRFVNARSIDLTSQGRSFAVATAQGVEIYDTARGSVRHLAVGSSSAVAFDPSDTLLAVASAGEVRVVRLDNLTTVKTFRHGFRFSGRHELHDMPPNRLHFGQGVLVMESAGKAAVASLNGGGAVKRLDARGVQQFTAGATKVIWPGGRGGLSVFHAHRGHTTLVPGHPPLRGVYRLAMSGDGALLAVVNGQREVVVRRCAWRR